MTVEYALKRAEIVWFFLQGLLKSPKLLGTVVVYSLIPGLLSLAFRGASSQSLNTADLGVAVRWALGTFCFMFLWVFLRAKTEQRTLTVSESGISTVIGSQRGRVPWNKVRAVTEAGQSVLIVLSNGNSFSVPSRAFSGPEERAQFLDEIERWRKPVR